MFQIIILFFVFLSSIAFSETDKCINIKTGADLTFRIPTSQWLKVNLKFSPDEKWLLKTSSDGLAIALNLETNKEIKLSLDSSIRDFQFSPDSKSIVVAGDSGLVIVKSLETGKEIEWKINDTVNTAQFSPDGKSILTASNNGKAAIRNLASGKEFLINHDQAVNSAKFSPDGKSIITASADGTAKIVNTETGKNSVIKHGRDVITASFSGNGKNTLTSSYDNTLIIKDLETNKETIVKHHAGLPPQASFDGKTILTSIDDKTIAIKNLATGKTSLIKHSAIITTAKISSDGKFAISSSYDKNVVIKNLENGTETKIAHQDTINSINFSTSGKSIITTSADGTVIVKNLSTGIELKYVHPDNATIAQLSADETSLIVASENEIIAKKSLESTCVKNNLTISAKKDCVDCVVDTTSTSLPQVSNSTDFEKTIIKSLCSKAYNSADWIKTLPRESKMRSEISKDEALLYLYKFQKPDSIDLSSDLSKMMAILSSNLSESYPELTVGMLTSVLVKSPNTYKQLLSLFPKISRFDNHDFTLATCRTSAEKEKVNNAIISYLKNLKNEKGQSLEYEDLKELNALTPVLKNLPPSQKESLIDTFATVLSDNAAKDPNFDGIFLSKLYKFSRQAVEPYFGNIPLPLTDLTSTTSTSRVRPIILGVSSIDNGLRTRYGFYSKTLPAIPFDLTTKSSMNWKMDNKKYNAEIELKKLNSIAMVPEGKSPDYKGLWKDKMLTGIVFAGSNLGDRLTSATLNRLLAYYQDQGFEFEKKTGSISNLPNFLKNEIESGRVDYISKQAHSDGDEKNIFRINVKARYEEGIKTLPDGNTEKIFLVFPEALDTETVLISNNDFGEWIQNREKNKGEQLVYLNTSCWSYTKAVNEIQASNSSLLLNIPTMTTVYTFENSPTSAEYLLFQALREKKSFQEMRTNLEKNPLYRNNKEANYFIFPDEEKYKEEITTKVQNQPRITISIKDQNGKDYNIDQFGH